MYTEGLFLTWPAILSHYVPRVHSQGPVPGAVRFSMVCACRTDKIEEAVVFAQTSLAPLRGLMTSRMGVSDAMLREVVALLAYEDPMVRVASCM